MSAHQPPASPPDGPGRDGSAGGGDGFGEDPLARLFRQLGLTGADGQVDLGAVMRQMQGFMTQMTGAADASASGVDWVQTRSLTRQVVASHGADPSQTSLEQRQVADALRLAAMWLDPATALPEVALRPAAWSRAEWVEHSMDNWRAIAEPIVTHIAAAMSGLIRGDAETSPEDPHLGALTAMLAPMARQAAATMYSQHLAQAIGTLATQVLSGNDAGLPLIDPPLVTLLPSNVAAFSEGLGHRVDDVLLYLVLREAARQRLFAGVPWLATQMLALVEHYAREIIIDANAMRDAMELGDLDSLTPDRMAEVSRVLQGKLFAPDRTPDQEAILARLETLTVFAEGWVETVVTAAAAPWMAVAPALSEMIRRRRVTGGPAETLLSSMLGLQLRPRRLRDAVNLWTAITQQCGVEVRDALWRHPDIMPVAADLDDVVGFVQRQKAPQPQDDALDAELARLLDQWRDSADGSGPVDPG